VSVVEPTPEPADPKHGISLRLVRPLVRHIVEQHGAGRLASAAAAVDLPLADLVAAQRFVTPAAFQRVLDALREVLDSDDAFRTAAGPRQGDPPYPWLLRHTCSVQGVYERAARRVGELVLGADIRVQRVGPGHLVLTARSAEPESSRLSCLLRIGLIEALPLQWKLGRAHVFETRCMARGDERCDYDVRFCEHSRIGPALAGLVLGLVLFAPLAALLGLGLTACLLAGIAGTAAGHALELARVSRASSHTAQAIQADMLHLGRAETEVRGEMRALEQRQVRWGDAMERELAERTASVDRIMGELRRLHDRRKTRLEGFSHDIRNPLTAIGATTQWLQQELRGESDEVRTALDDLEFASRHVERLLGELLRTSASDSQLVRRAPERLDIGRLGETLQARLRALTYGRPVASRVEVSPAAPAVLEIDRLRFDRVVDNVLSNAAKYTEHGQISVTLSGGAGMLTLEVSDTGRGIAESELERIFRPRRDSTQGRPSPSWGIGLSVVVRLLDQMGGRLEVMSQPGKGTTFWLHLPLQPPAPTPERDGATTGFDDDRWAASPVEAVPIEAGAVALAAEGGPEAPARTPVVSSARAPSAGASAREDGRAQAIKQALAAEVRASAAAHDAAIRRVVQVRAVGPS
jgi:signal transduction histidine kinase